MTGRVGQLAGREIWLRCPYCGDSQSDPDKAHFSINLAHFIYYCFRCGASGQLTTKQAFELTSQLTGDGALDFTDEADDEGWPTLLPGAAVSRRSALDRFHYTDLHQHHWDAFQMRHPKDNTVTGIHMRSGKHRLSLGDKGLAWAGAQPLLSEPGHPIRIVEGPYDVTGPQEACVFGLITEKALADLSGQSVCVCPDGDVWRDVNLFRNTVRMVQRLLDNRRIFLVGLEFIPDGKDPDEVPAEDREFVARVDLYKFIASRAKQLAIITAEQEAQWKT